MKQVYLTIVVFFVSIFFQAFQFDNQTTSLAAIRLKNGLELALHDATMAVIEEEYANGYVVFDQPESEKLFRRTLVANLQLDEKLVPLDGTLFTTSMKYELYYADDRITGGVYPYHYVDAFNNIDEWVYGPSIIGRITTANPLRRAILPETNLVRTAVYEYLVTPID